MIIVDGDVVIDGIKRDDKRFWRSAPVKYWCWDDMDEQKIYEDDSLDIYDRDNKLRKLAKYHYWMYKKDIYESQWHFYKWCYVTRYLEKTYKEIHGKEASIHGLDNQ